MDSLSGLPMHACEIRIVFVLSPEFCSLMFAEIFPTTFQELDLNIIWRGQCSDC